VQINWKNKSADTFCFPSYLFEYETEGGDFSPSKMFNVGETDLKVVQHKASKVLAMKGKKQISCSSAERSVLITVTTCMSASDTYVSSQMFFSCQNMKVESLEGGPTGTIGAV
jgi:hypothetical protein